MILFQDYTMRVSLLVLLIGLSVFCCDACPPAMRSLPCYCRCYDLLTSCRQHCYSKQGRTRATCRSRCGYLYRTCSIGCLPLPFYRPRSSWSTSYIRWFFIHWAIHYCRGRICFKIMKIRTISCYLFFAKCSVFEQFVKV